MRTRNNNAPQSTRLDNHLLLLVSISLKPTDPVDHHKPSMTQNINTTDGRQESQLCCVAHHARAADLRGSFTLFRNRHGAHLFHPCVLFAVRNENVNLSTMLQSLQEKKTTVHFVLCADSKLLAIVWPTPKWVKKLIGSKQSFEVSNWCGIQHLPTAVSAECCIVLHCSRHFSVGRTSCPRHQHFSIRGNRPVLSRTKSLLTLTKKGCAGC